MSTVGGANPIRAVWMQGLCTALAVVLGGPAVADRADQRAGRSWADEWELAPGFALEVDASNFDFPSAIAFVPNPGPDPDDPLYFVTELRGRIKVVTNDRSVHIFAEDFFRLDPMADIALSPRLPELGMAGIALDEKNGYVFVSFGYHNEAGDVKFNIVRFDSKPGKFSLEPSGWVAFTDVFSDHPGDDSHMIGPLAIHDDLLYVSVGDAHAMLLVSKIDSPLGKVLRMTVDGDPVSSNPFYIDQDRKKIRNYVFALGFRNPFGLRIVEGEIFVNDVGPGVDRFLRVEEGKDYQYDGTDWSFGAHNDMLFAPSVSPVQLDFHDVGQGPFPALHQGKHYMATSGSQSETGPSVHGERSVLALEWDFEGERVRGRPKTIMRYRGDQGTMPVGLAFGPDGLYVATLSRDREKKHDILKILWRPDDPHSHVIGRAQEMIEKAGCIGCHRDAPGAPAPALRPKVLIPELQARLDSSEYLEASLALDEVDEEPYSLYREERRRIREAEGRERVELWIRTRLLEPRFDDPTAIMPKLGLTPAEAGMIAEYLSAASEQPEPLQRFELWVAGFFPDPRLRHLLGFFLAGSFLTLLILGLAALFIRLRMRSG